MKKLLLGAILALSATTYSLDTHLRFGGITTGKTYSGVEAGENFAPTVGLELTQSLILFDVGAGIQYNGGDDTLDIATVPAYLLARWNIIPIGIKPYLVAKVGKSIYTKEKFALSNPEATYFYGAGVGVNISFLQGEILYSRTELDDFRRYDHMDQVSLTLGYRF
ncbi:MAG: hypothetical protein ACRCZ9_11625 [Fusobacteriaceae bacterium]